MTITITDSTALWDCPCWGLGCVIRDRNNGAMFEWPCPFECMPPLVCAAVNNRRRTWQ